MARNNSNGKRLTTQQSVNSTIKTICDIMRRSNCAGAMEYVPELTWLLFLRILDERETYEAEEAEAVGLPYRPSLVPPYRWRDWAAPGGSKRVELQNAELGAFFQFLHEDLLPHIRSLNDPQENPGATARQKVLGQVLSNVERVRVDTEYNMWEVIDRVHEIKDDSIDPTHIFPLSQVYEGLLLRMGEKRNDGGQFFTPREVIRAMVRAIDPQVGQTVYDPGCGTGGFLAQAYEYMRQEDLLPTDIERLKHDSFYGREKDNTVYPIALANLVLHGIDQPNLWHGNTLTGQEMYGGLFEDAPMQYDVVLTNPPFGGKEGKEAQTQFDYKTSSTQVLFLQHVIDSVAEGGKCGIVLDEGVLFRANQSAFVKTKTKLLDECDVWCIVSLPGGVFTQAGAGVKTNLVFLTKGRPTERIWYYDLSHLKIRKRTPLRLTHFEHFFEVLPERAESEYSWTVDVEARKEEAAKEAAPIKERAQAKRREAERLGRKVKEMKAALRQQAEPVQLAFGEGEGADTVTAEAVEALDKQVKAVRKEARELSRRAQAIEEAVYDLKAVNPNAQIEEDTRTPEELMAIIEEKGREVAEALAVLRGTG